MEIIEMHGVEATKQYMRLFRICRDDHFPVSGFTQSASSVVSGQALYLKKHLQQRRFFLRKNNQILASAIAFIPIKGTQASLGGFLASRLLTREDLHLFYDQILSVVGQPLLMPLNGHVNFGVSAVLPSTPADKITVLTSAHCPGHEALFDYAGVKSVKEYFALSTPITEHKVVQWKSAICQLPPGFSTRPISLIHFKRDIAIHNELCNLTMQHLDYFEPLSEDESWDLMRSSLPLISPDLFQFLMFKGKEIGFCFGMLDFNQIIGRSGDMVAAAKVMLLRRKITRGRILSTGILPEFRSQNLIKYARNRVLLAFAAKGIEAIESSYVDELNANSLLNVRSKGGEVSHSFKIFRSI